MNDKKFVYFLRQLRCSMFCAMMSILCLLIASNGRASEICQDYLVKIDDLVLKVPNKWGTTLRNNGTDIVTPYCHRYDGKVIEASYVSFGIFLPVNNNPDAKKKFVQFHITPYIADPYYSYDAIKKQIEDKGLNIESLPIIDGYYYNEPFNYISTTEVVPFDNTPLTISAPGYNAMFHYKPGLWMDIGVLPDDHLKRSDWIYFHHIMINYLENITVNNQ